MAWCRPAGGGKRSVWLLGAPLLCCGPLEAVGGRGTPAVQKGAVATTLRCWHSAVPTVQLGAVYLTCSEFCPPKCGEGSCEDLPWPLW